MQFNYWNNSPRKDFERSLAFSSWGEGKEDELSASLYAGASLVYICIAMDHIELCKDRESLAMDMASEASLQDLPDLHLAAKTHSSGALIAIVTGQDNSRSFESFTYLCSTYAFLCHVEIHSAGLTWFQCRHIRKVKSVICCCTKVVSKAAQTARLLLTLIGSSNANLPHFSKQICWILFH